MKNYYPKFANDRGLHRCAKLSTLMMMQKCLQQDLKKLFQCLATYWLMAKNPRISTWHYTTGNEPTDAPYSTSSNTARAYLSMVFQIHHQSPRVFLRSPNCWSSAYCRCRAETTVSHCVWVWNLFSQSVSQSVRWKWE